MAKFRALPPRAAEGQSLHEFGEKREAVWQLINERLTVLASTPKGAAAVKEMLKKEKSGRSAIPGIGFGKREYQFALERGAMLRERNAAVAAAGRASRKK